MTPPTLHRFAVDAMNTTFEILIDYDDAVYARQAARAAMDLLPELEAQLSRHQPDSDIACLNRKGLRSHVPLGPAAWDCLTLAREVCEVTAGAFDPTVGALLLAKDNTRRLDALTRVGMDLLELDDARLSATLSAEGVVVDLGGIGKGHAIDAMAEVLREWSIERAMLHGGQSTALAVGETLWPVVLRDPADEATALAEIELCNAALSGSAMARRADIIDPRTARPAERYRATWAIAPQAALADALSTAFMLLPRSGIEACLAHWPDTAAATLDKTGTLTRLGL